jgi:peptidoglycan/xylan/chitin deacetylase (PgdA/CDA1 family)
MNKGMLLSLFEASGAYRVNRFLQRKRPMVLMYHRVLNDPLLPGISPDIFAQQLAYLKKNFRVVPVNQLISEINEGIQKPYSVALTFDDGHQDFYTNAWPLLKKYQLPASLYVTTGFVDSTCWLWPDLLRYILINTQKKTFEIAGLGELTLRQSNLLNTWNRLGDYCLTLKTVDRDQFLQSLAQRFEVDIDIQPQTPFSAVTWDQLIEMQNEGLDVGSHTVSHPILSDLDEEQLIKELEGSYQRIANELGNAPTGICYPNGMARDTSALVEKHAAAFYRYGLVAYPCAISANNRMHLGRWSAANNMRRFKQIMNAFSHHDNQYGEYR